MNLAQLRALVAVTDAGGFTAAAAVLGLTQSGVSHAVASLEHELDLPLLVRSGRSVRLTTHGEQIIGHAREVLCRTERITDLAAAAGNRRLPRLRLAAFPSAGQLLPSVIAAFSRHLPDVTVVLLEGSDAEVRAWLHDKVIDAGVVAELDDDASDIGGVALHRDRMLAVLDAHHPLAGQPSVTLADLADDDFLLSDNGCEPLLNRMYHRAGLPLTPHRRVRDMATLLALVKEQLGVTIVPELCLTGAPAALAAVPINPAAHRALHLVAADTEPLTTTVQTLLDVAATNIRPAPTSISTSAVGPFTDN